MRRPLSLAARLTVWYGVSGFVLVALSSGALYWSLTKNLDFDADLFLADHVHVFRRVLAERPGDVEALAQEAEVESSARRFAKIYARVTRADGTVVTCTPGLDDAIAPPAFPVPVAVDSEPEGGAALTLGDGREFRIMSALGASGVAGESPYLIEVALDRAHESAILAGFRLQLAIVDVGTLLVCLLVSHAIARRGLRPIREITSTARRIGSATLHERLDIAVLPAEIAELARTFNEMLDRLADSFGRLSRFSADLAHELRTPVNNLRGEVEVALGRARTSEEYRETLSSCLEEAARLARTIDSLLFLARAESSDDLVRREPIEVSAELERVRAFYDAAASEAGLRIDVEPTAELRAALDRSLLQRALGNLVANAIAHTPEGGAITLRASRDGDRLAIDVADTGRGIAASDLPHVFERFYRADPSRTTELGATNVGLGLAIVRSIAELHGGSASIDSAPGKGTRVRLAFPVAATTA
jgi:two-component system, OmpR family, heavy metal sensor histidine kinase CusS